MSSNIDIQPGTEVAFTPTSQAITVQQQQLELKMTALFFGIFHSGSMLLIVVFVSLANATSFIGRKAQHLKK
ncbi:MAG: hypothetical protein EZS28_037308 [Streblomastix strix]|uniref:Uncharacterized protein n=1 Tax=Streblomastix strix TaxID=222440 RepID=A0A5J4UAB5_9EUKA|nr:MAG: hypothetical protein EZS28_037308 [Streblomastix strix]